MSEHLTKVTRKGQITVPAEVRRALGLSEGDSVAVLLENGQARIERRASVVARTAGMVRTARPALSPEQEREEFERSVAEDALKGLDP